MIWLVSWQYNGNEFRGFVKAESADQASAIAMELLSGECVVTSVSESWMHMVTPQSITLNFPNESVYTTFG